MSTASSGIESQRSNITEQTASPIIAACSSALRMRKIDVGAFNELLYPRTSNADNSSPAPTSVRGVAGAEPIVSLPGQDISIFKIIIVGTVTIQVATSVYTPQAYSIQQTSVPTIQAYSTQQTSVPATQTPSTQQSPTLFPTPNGTISAPIPSVGFQTSHSDKTKKWILPLGLVISILLICSGLLAVSHIRRRQRKMHDRLLPYIPERYMAPVDSLNSSSTLTGNSSSVTLKDLKSNTHQKSVSTTSSSTGSKGSSTRSTTRTSCRSHIRNTPLETSPALPSVLNRVVERLEDTTASMTRRTSPRDEASWGHDRGVFFTSSQSSREEVEVLRERLRVVENIAFTMTDQTTGTDDVINLGRELRELIPPPKYASVRPNDT